MPPKGGNKRGREVEGGSIANGLEAGLAEHLEKNNVLRKGQASKAVADAQSAHFSDALRNSKGMRRFATAVRAKMRAKGAAAAKAGEEPVLGTLTNAEFEELVKAATQDVKDYFVVGRCLQGTLRQAQPLTPHQRPFALRPRPFSTQRSTASWASSTGPTTRSTRQRTSQAATRAASRR